MPLGLIFYVMQDIMWLKCPNTFLGSLYSVFLSTHRKQDFCWQLSWILNLNQYSAGSSLDKHSILLHVFIHLG